MGKLFLLFTAVPLVELYLLMQLSEAMGLGATIALVLLTGGLGAALAKAEGLRVLRNWQASLSAGQMPEDGVVEGLLVLVGGVLLITPGVLTDFVGFALLIPATRRGLAKLIMARIQRGIERGTIRVTTSRVGFDGPFEPPSHRPHGGPNRPRAIDRDVIEVEAKVVDSKG